MSVLIDGYNVIYASRELGEYMDEGKIEKARHGLVSRLTRYATHRKEDITVVFDGKTGHYPDSSRKSFTFEKIRILFTGRNKTADDRMIEITAASKHPGDITVVSSDRLVMASARRIGAHVSDSSEYIREIESKLQESDRTAGRSKIDVPYISYEEYMNMLKEHEQESSPEDS